MRKKHLWYLLGVIRAYSGEMLEHALIAGLLSVGIRVYKLGVIATPVPLIWFIRKKPAPE